MQLSGEILYQYCLERYPVSRFGRNLLQEAFSLPLFYTPGTQLERGRTYIVRTRELPKTAPPNACFYVLAGDPRSAGAAGRAWFCTSKTQRSTC